MQPPWIRHWILGLLFTLGPLFIMDIPSSLMDFPNFGAHTGFFEEIRHHQWRVQDLEEGGAEPIAREARAQNFKPRPSLTRS